MNKRHLLGSFAATALARRRLRSQSHGNAAGEATVIDLTQTACQFVEVEGVDHGFSSGSKADCETINADSGAERLANARRP